MLELIFGRYLVFILNNLGKLKPFEYSVVRNTILGYKQKLNVEQINFHKIEYG